MSRESLNRFTDGDFPLKFSLTLGGYFLKNIEKIKRSELIKLQEIQKTNWKKGPLWLVNVGSGLRALLYLKISPLYLSLKTKNSTIVR